MLHCKCEISQRLFLASVQRALIAGWFSINKYYTKLKTGWGTMSTPCTLTPFTWLPWPWVRAHTCTCKTTSLVLVHVSILVILPMRGSSFLYLSKHTCCNNCTSWILNPGGSFRSGFWISGDFSCSPWPALSISHQVHCFLGVYCSQQGENRCLHTVLLSLSLKAVKIHGCGPYCDGYRTQKGIAPRNHSYYCP